MNIDVTKDEVIIDKNSDKAHENEYKITECHFTFDDFTNSFQVKRAIFTILSTGEKYEIDIINNKCDIPIEVLGHAYETVKLGVYGYNIEIVDEEETLKERFSPSYDTFVVPTGSYEDGALSPEIITPSQYDIYSQALQEGLDDVAEALNDVTEALEEVSHVDIDAEQLEHGASVTITNRYNQPKEVVVNDGYTPVKGVDYFTTSEIEEIENTVKTDVITELDFDNTIAGIEQEISDLNTNKASKIELEGEESARELADTNLQEQIDALTSSKDVVDIVGTYSDLQNYDTSTLTEDDVIKVLDDSTHNDAMSYYRWSNNTWNYIGSEGPFYTKSETDERLNTKQAKIDSEHKLASDSVDDTNQTHKFTSTNEKNTWNAKYDKPSNGIPKSDLVASVQESLNKADTAIQDVSDKEDKSNKVTEINSSSTDTQYPSAKCVYDSQEEQNEQITELEMLYNAFPTVSDEDTTIQLDNTAKVKFREIDLKGNTSQVVIPEEQGTSVSNTSIYVSDVNTDKEHTIEMSGNTYQATSILPSEYTQVDYIESSGTQYIDTGVNADSNLSVKTEIAISTITGAFGAISNASGIYVRHHFNFQSSQGIRYYILECSAYQLIPQVDTDTNRHNYDIDIYNHKIVVDGSTPITTSSDSFDVGLNYWLFRRNANTDNLRVYSVIKLYKFKMYYENVLVRDFVPCYRNSDNEVGLYDLVNNVFYTNQGTGAFTYGAVVSIPNPDYPQNIEVVTGTQNVEVCGKNLFDKSNVNVLNAYFTTSIPTITSSSSDRTIYIPCEPNTTYTISKNLAGYGRAVGYTSTIPAISSSVEGTINISANSASGTITTGANANYLVMRAFNVGQDTLTYQQVLASIQIEKGTQATTYEPYTGITYPVNLGNIELCRLNVDNTIYKDRIYLLNNKWYLEKNIIKTIINGSEGFWFRASINTNTLRFNNEYAIPNGYVISAIKIISNKFINGSGPSDNGDYEHIRNGGSTYPNTLSIIIDKTRLPGNTADNFTTWLSNNNVTVYYLATPTTTEITDTNLVNQLNALYNATIYPITNINTDTSNLLPYIDLHYNFVTPSPSPSRPSVVNVVKGNNTITISNSDNTESQSYPINLGDIELCKIGTYQDYIYESNGNWYLYKNIDKKFENSFTAIMAITSTLADNLYGYACNTQGISSYSELGAIISNIFVPKILGSQTDTTNPNNVRFNMGIAKHPNNKQVVITIDKKYLETGTTTEFSNFLNNNNFEYYYVLATPTITEITDNTLIGQLNALEKAYSYDTQTNISQINADKPFIINAEAIMSLKNIFNS